MSSPAEPDPLKGGKAAPERIALALYSALLRVLTPVLLLRYAWRSRAEPLYRHALLERLGVYRSAAPVPGALWLHAVSLGETRAAAALVDALRGIRPDLRFVFTHGTATGLEAGRALLREGDVQAWLPVDTPGAVRRFLAHFRPRLGVLMETEVWPNLLHAAQRAGLAVVLANARLSEKSLRKGERFSALLRPALRSLEIVLAQTEDDARRLRSGGAREVVVLGNLKFDLTPDLQLQERGRAWRGALGRNVVLAASTREGEEPVLLHAWREHCVRLATPLPLLLIVPRHPQRFEEVAALIRSSGVSMARRSVWADVPPRSAHEADVWLGDSLGEMALYYSAAHVALLGGSFAPLGGQNLIEAAACGCPVVMGPHTFNFAEAAELAVRAGAAIRVADLAEAVARGVALCATAEACDWSKRASAFAASHRGAALRMANVIADSLSR